MFFHLSVAEVEEHKARWESDLEFWEESERFWREDGCATNRNDVYETGSGLYQVVFDGE